MVVIGNNQGQYEPQLSHEGQVLQYTNSLAVSNQMHGVGRNPSQNQEKVRRSPKSSN